MRMGFKAIFVALGFAFLCASAYAQEVPEENWRRQSYVFDGKLDRTIPWVGQKPGAVKEALNVARPAASVSLGWGPRTGTTRHNTSAIGAYTIKALSQYTNAFHDTDSFIAQSNDQLYLADNDPPSSAGGAFGSAIYSLDSGASPMFAEPVNDYWVGAAAGTTPFIWSGGTEYPRFFFISHNSAVSSYVDGTDDVSDDRDDTYVLFVEDSGETAYIGSPLRLDGFYVELTGATNIEAAGLYVKAYQNGSWADVAGLSDGTADATGVTTLYESEGHVTWSFDEDDDPFLLPENQEHLFWYKTGVTADITDGVKINRLRVNADCQSMTNLWSGYYENVASALLSSATGFVDYTGEVTDGTSVNYLDLNGENTLYIGSPYPVFAVYFYIDPEYPNLSSNVYLQDVSYWDGDNRQWTAVSGATNDSTSSDDEYAMHHNGAVQWDGSTFQEDKMRLGGASGTDLSPIYFYKLEWSGAFSSETHIYEIAVAQKPESIPPMNHYDGFIEHAGRVFAWPGDKFKHGMDFAQEGDPFVWNGQKAGSTGDIFGPGIVNAAARLSSYVVVSTEHPHRLYLMQGKSPGSFDELLLASNVGAVAPHTMVTIEDGVRLFSTELVYNAVVLMAPDGFYATDGRKPLSISQPIADYFDTGSTPYIEPAHMHKSFAVVDYENRVVLFGVPLNVENNSTTQTTCNYILPYSYINDEWWDRWELSSDAACGTNLVGSNDQRLTYLGDHSGYVWRFEGDTDNETRIEHWVKTPDFFLGKSSDALNRKTRLRAVKTKTKTDTVGNVEVVLYPEGAKSGVSPTVNTMSLVRSGYDYTKGRINCNEAAESFAIRFRAGYASGDAGAEMEIYGFTCDYYDVRDTQP